MVGTPSGGNLYHAIGRKTDKIAFCGQVFFPWIKPIKNVIQHVGFPVYTCDNLLLFNKTTV
jgi:hypothetical protein